MIKRYESYVYIDLMALREHEISDGDVGEVTDAADSCAGKVLLMFTGRGMELVHVPSVMN
jgi:hypothetical protein